MSEQGTDTVEVDGLIYQFVRTYVSRRLASKYDLTWDKVKGNKEREHEYGDKREKIAKEAFLAVRSRSGDDFISYFAATLGSVPQNLKEPDFVALARALRERPEQIRTLTMLALSATA